MQQQKLQSVDITKVQVVGWLVLYCIHVAYYWPVSGVAESFVTPFIAVGFYLLIIYGNVLWLIPTWYARGRVGQYAAVLFLFFVAVVAVRMWVNYEVLFVRLNQTMYDYSPRQIAYVAFSTFLTVIISVVAYAAIRYFSLLKMEEAREAQRYRAELDLLKARVQPHFLFNTLNNIYYEAYRESPRAAALIDKLSGMMRYFVEESPREQVALSTEIAFLQNYIDLERIRMRHQLQLTFELPVITTQQIPPMLLMPLVENLFKHGIDKRKPENPVAISLQFVDEHLVFTVANPLPEEKHSAAAGGFGLKNLRQRLQMLYTDFTLRSEAEGNRFVSTLSIPLA
ncbi:sensor histidine kinase [Chryseolinea lacunae]|uniref:Histidine kinase n=1 Tax=Chryseolinea lacunae TaxID=2801331 RepID=A0ABS1KYY8_9BACT|nr:histidine kinase [Chryseolinea lacunae]MBL0744604.1 histidine kinase [Chryseolinea lacunae]